ncbi:choice-of-anchor F family protein [Thiomicrorhabdus aquaedulcis]|uniref:choice-of-anchor F family protein n=1 Tax=Thiomicrorhabdus aquaedulcis TaxID=2211106 RepID=UPI000FDC5949|nr:choice-of-anchor F family protein [Thiomicrorhabdus aquaedulcis]
MKTQITHSFPLTLVTVACLTAFNPAWAGKITGIQQGAPSPLLENADAWKNGFGGFNLDNVEVKIINVETGEEIAGKTFNKTDGSYTPMTYGETFVSHITDGGETPVVTGHLHGKDWPVGEPSGIKTITHPDISEVLANNKPASCIMSTSYYEYSELPNNLTAGGWLDSMEVHGTEPNPTLCDSPFQTHKRFKIDALPTSVDGVGADAIDIVFNVENEADTTTPRRYQVLQKLNNYTDKRLAGYKVELGFGVGENFIALADNTNLSLSIGTGENPPNNEEDPVGDIWDADDLAVFSSGLFGTADDKHPVDGFFDTRRAGYFVALSENKTTIQSTTVMPSNYTKFFGDWLPSVYKPSAIFYDDDKNPLTDATLVAFWGDNPATPDTVDYQWLSGNANNFAPISSEQLSEWSSNTGMNDGSNQYSIGGVEDLLNLGLSYIVNIGNVSAFTDSKFTLRMVPIVSQDQSVPGHVSNPAPETFVETPLETPVVTPTVSSSSGGSASAMDLTALITTFLLMLGLGGWIMRKKSNQ